MAIKLTPDQTVGVFLSGGADSALLLYLLTHLYPDQKIVLLTIASEDKQYNVRHALDVIEFIKKHNEPTNILDHVVVIAPDQSQRKDMRNRQVALLTEKYGIDFWYSGKTKNPGVELECHEERKLERDADLQEWSDCGTVTNPFYGVDKSHLLEIYRERNLMRLFSLTISCEKSAIPCGDCWWCHERNWAENATARNL